MKNYCVGAMCFLEVEANSREEAIKKFFKECPMETYEVDTVMLQNEDGFWEESYND